jgi:hypothetical protein
LALRVGGSRNKLATELYEEPAVLRGLGKLAHELTKNVKLRSEVETLCNRLRKGDLPKRLTSFS